MSRFLRCGASLTTLAVVGTLAAASALASSPPRSPLLFDPLNGSLGGVRLHDPMQSLFDLLGPPDRTIRLTDGLPVFFWPRGKALCTAWAEAYPGDPASSGLGVFSYVGPVITRRGDRLGTPLNAVRKHWVRSWQYLADVSGGPGPNYAHLARFGSATFGFDGHNRVGGVSIRTDHQSWQPIVVPPC